MGHFLAVTAYQNTQPDLLLNTLSAYCSEVSVGCSESKVPQDSKDGLIYPPQNGWTVFLWPSYYNVVDLQSAQTMSGKLRTLVSSIHVYDDDYWTHGLFQNGENIDLFCSHPEYHGTGFFENRRLAKLWSGSSEKIAAACGIPPERIAGYLRNNRKLGSKADTRVHAEDQFDLSNFWVFVDFWKKLGINYPVDMTGFVKAVRFSRDANFKMPAGSFEL